MRQLLLRILIAVALFIGVVALIGSLLPRDFSVTAHTKINAPPDVIFNQINELKNWKEWSGWSEKFTSEIEIEYGTPSQGQGASKRWKDARGVGKVWITESIPNERIACQLEFGGFKDIPNTFEIRPDGDVSTVTWASEGQLPAGPFYGFFGFLFEAGMEAEFQKNLDRLKAIAEDSVK